MERRKSQTASSPRRCTSPSFTARKTFTTTASPSPSSTCIFRLAFFGCLLMLFTAFSPSRIFEATTGPVVGVEGKVVSCPMAAHDSPCMLRVKGGDTATFECKNPSPILFPFLVHDHTGAYKAIEKYVDVEEVPKVDGDKFTVKFKASDKKGCIMATCAQVRAQATQSPQHLKEDDLKKRTERTLIIQLNGGEGYCDESDRLSKFKDEISAAFGLGGRYRGWLGGWTVTALIAIAATTLTLSFEFS